MAEAQTRRTALRVRVAGLVRASRDVLDPTEAPEDLDPDQIMDSAVQLAAALADLAEVTEEIRTLERLLG
jgi:hypothetical protein